MEDTVAGMMALGFSRMEAEVYTALCRQSPMTGYRVAQAIGKPVANTYKAIEALRNKGAVLVDDGASRLCRVVPPAEFFGGLERRFHEQKESVTRALSEVAHPENDTRIYQLGAAEQVLERCRSMLQNCKEVALLDIFPLPLEVLRSEMEQAAARGVLVAAKVYAPAKIPGVEIALHPQGRSTQKRWPGQWVNIVVDGAEHLLGFLTADIRAVHQAVWSGSPYLSWVYHCGLSSEIILAALLPLIEKGAASRELQKVLRRYRQIPALQSAGYKKLVKQFKGDSR